MSSDLEDISKTYSPKDVEKKWYKLWDDGKYFKPRKGKAQESYCIIMPPPNVTGRLHAGHALDVTTQDALIRFKRMKGFETLWLPGMDHAGIATQSVVEKMVWEKEKKTRHDFTREEFLQKIWKWKEEYGGIIIDQQRSLGASPDWDYSVFTMDEMPNRAVKKVFTQLYNEGLIYQSDYIVNWDPVLQSAISDAEVEHLEVNGAFYNLRYKIKDSDDFLEIATTRPETLLGDTAVCVHPDDERFQKYIGKTAILPLSNREIPIIADSYVDMEKGTGCLKVTPGHDFNDFEIGKRHQLPIINILNLDGTLNDEYGGEWAGLTCVKARRKIVALLEEQGILLSTKSHSHQVGHGDRSKAIIEPMVSKQWFLKTDEMAADAVNAIENDTTKFYPKGWENTYFAWLRNPKPWCLSRQLWWGHQIPVFYCDSCNHQWASEITETKCCSCQSDKIHQDPDVLDTWFSSGLWPLSTLGWPDPEVMKERKFKTFFPTTTLVTGFDIIFFWVARMMMMGLKAVGEVPFEKIYIHAIVRDKLGRKMSKSLGNGLDPLDIIDEYGADAFRFTLAAGSGYNRNLNLDPEKIFGHRNFINKIWNAFRFISPSLEQASSELPDLKTLDHHERWILAELNTVAQEMNSSMEDFRYDDSCSSIYAFVYDKFCSWFIELSKPILASENDNEIKRRASVLKYTLRKIVALLHPITPFITEELWSFLKDENEDLLIIQDYPEFTEDLTFSDDQEMMRKFIDIVSGVRNLRASLNIKPKDIVEISLFSDDSKLTKYIENNQEAISEQAKVHKNFLTQETKKPRPITSVVHATTHTEIHLIIKDQQIINDQINRLKKDLLKTEKEFSKYDKKLSNPKFADNAPEDVITEVKQKASEFSEKMRILKENIERFES